MKTASLGLWEGLSHSALLRLLIVWEYGTVSIGLLCTLHFLALFVAAKTNWREKIWNTSFLEEGDGLMLCQKVWRDRETDTQVKEVLASGVPPK